MKKECEQCGTTIFLCNSNRRFCDHCRKERSNAVHKRYNDEHLEQRRAFSREYERRQTAKMRGLIARNYELALEVSMLKEKLQEVQP